VGVTVGVTVGKTVAVTGTVITGVAGERVPAVVGKGVLGSQLHELLPSGVFVDGLVMETSAGSRLFWESIVTEPVGVDERLRL